MRKLIVILSLWIGSFSFSQQLPQQTQYLFNQYAFNPAYAGVTDYWETVMNNRYQWIGLVDAPRTFTLTAQGPFKNKKMGIGASVYTDIVGPTRRLGFQASYAYHLQLNETIKLSMAVAFGFNEWLIDADKIITYHADDPFFSNGLIKSFSPDAKFGLYLYHEDWYFGAASPQLLHNNIKFKDLGIDTKSYLEDHIYINGGYRFQLGDDFELEPNFLLKFGFPAPLKLDIGVKATYKETVWLGMGYRNSESVTAMIGYMHDQNLLFGYAYDIGISSLKAYNAGSHEIFFAIRFGKINQ